MSDLPNLSTLSNLMPDAEGVNFYSADPDLSFLLRGHLSDEDYERAQLILAHLGSVASREMDELAAQANCQGPVLVQYDKKGQRIDEGLDAFLSLSNSRSATWVCRPKRASSVRCR